MDFGLESVEFVFYGFDRIVVVYQLPDVVGVERRAEQGVARSRKNAVRKGDVFLGPLRVPACEFAYQKVQRVLAAVEVSGFPRFGERRVPIGRCEFETVSAQVGQLDVYPFPADGIVCLSACDGPAGADIAANGNKDIISPDARAFRSI